MEVATTLEERLTGIRARIDAACARSGRPPGDATLLAVSKTVPAEVIAEAWRAGQREFGESRQQEAAAKVRELPPDIVWHFIGRLQGNKVRKVLADFAVIHGVDSLKLAAQIDRIAGELGRRPRVFLEVNLGQEPSKGGFDPAELAPAVDSVMGMPHLELEGLMAIPPVEDGDVAGARRWFRELRELRDVLREKTGAPLPGLSMGMSGDFEVAIEEGSTLVRVGTAIFG